MGLSAEDALAFLDEQHQAFHDTIARVPEGDREQRAHPVRWSIAEIVQHLAMVETRVAGSLRGALEQARRDDVKPQPEYDAAVDPADVARWTDRSRPVTAPDRA